MILSEKELRLLAVTELDAGMPLAKIRKETNQRSHTIRYSLKRLEDKGIIDRAPFIDVYPLGYTGHAIFLSIAPSGIALRDEFISTLKASPKVQWLAELGGDYQYVATVFTRRLSELVVFFDELSEVFGDIVFEKTISSRIEFVQFNRKYFGGKPKSLRFGSDQVEDIDDVDHKILSGMANDLFETERKLSLRLQIPTTTLRNRVKKLKEKKLIVGDFYQIDARKFGMETYEVLVSAKGASKQLRDELFLFSKAHENIVHFVTCLGQWDYEIGVEVNDGHELTVVLQAIAEKFGSRLVSLRTLSIFKHLKYSLYPFSFETNQ
ncbi:MAG: Lrp/AsnC family transcriptional regulator [Parcubacteria group bacterium]|nr:Lrp/AsnC family transcriptional regulator [Parcubacteria group bacterium]